MEQVAGGALAAWPVGSIFISAVSTDPAILLGGGTWERFGQGRVLVSQDDSDPSFDTAEETGGAKTATLPNHAHSMSHTHTIAHTHNLGTSAWAHISWTQSSIENLTLAMKSIDPGANWTANRNALSLSSGGNVSNATRRHAPHLGGTTDGSNTASSGAASSSNTGNPTTSPTISTVQPYIVTYIWKRTA